MSLGNIFSVGDDFDYPLIGGESLHELLPKFNEKFSLSMTEEEFPEQSAKRRESDGLIALVAINKEGSKIYNFINMTNTGVVNVTTIQGFQPEQQKVIMKKPVNFKEELTFLSSVTPNLVVDYTLLTSKTITNLQRLLQNYDYGNWNIVGGTDDDVADFILRYYGTGDGVPAEYGEYAPDVTVAIIDLKRQGLYSTYCLRTKKYHVYDNGYRSGN